MSLSLPLPTDILLLVFAYLDVRDVLRFRQVCKDFDVITRERSIWHALLLALVREQDTPIPRAAHDPPLRTLSCAELENCARRALRLRANWTAPAPVPTRTAELFPVLDDDIPARNVALHFFGRRYLAALTVAGAGPARAYFVQAWDAEASPPALVAHRVFSGHHRIVFNDDPAAAAVFAVQGIDTELYAFDAAAPPHDTFVRTHVFPGRADEPLAFAGTLFAAAAPGEDVLVWDTARPAHTVRLAAPPAPPGILGVLLRPDTATALVLRTQSIDVYALAPLRAPLAPAPAPAPAAPALLAPQRHHAWQWKLDSIAAVPGPAGTTALLVRFGSWFPWPINLLHRYVLPRGGGAPALTQALAAPVHMFAASPMALGRRGTALWADSHAEEVAGPGQGQRLAGACAPAAGEGEGATEAGAVAATAVYALRAHDGWVRVAMDEDEGRIAAGGATGEITLFDFA